jgi:predicted nucleotidyltransferase
MPRDDREVLLEKLRTALQSRHDIRVALLFGSSARGSARLDSDVDVAVLAPAVDWLTLSADLSIALGRDVDVVPLETAGIPLVQEVLRDGIVVHEGEPGAAALFRSRALATLETDLPWFARMRDAWLRRVAERGIGG